MEVVQFVHEGLGNSSYLVSIGGGNALAVDPDRSVRRYLQAAEGKGLRITGVLETHVHADFVTGALEIAAATGATAYTPAESGVQYPHRPVAAGEAVRIEAIEAMAIGSPGHTPEHLSYALRAPGSAPLLFSGGSLIVGGAARTDLIAPDRTEELTRVQYHTLREAFAHLADDTTLYPTHGGGSFCSAGGGSERTSTLGEQRAVNPVLGEMTEEEFVDWFPRTFPGAPKYYFKMRAINQAGPRLRRDLPMPPALTASAFQAAASDALIVDVRSPGDYLAGHIQGSLSNPFRDVFGVWLGWLVPLDTHLLFVTGGVPLDDVVDEALLVGHENLAGYLNGGIEAWQEAGLGITFIPAVSAEEAQRVSEGGVFVLDVREPDEFAAGHLEGATSIPLGELDGQLHRVPRERPVLAYCGRGQRSASAVSALERAGFGPLMNVAGGFAEWQAAGGRVVR